MTWLDAVAVLAVAQYLGFGMVVAWARGRYGVRAPAVSGHAMFERFYRVHMNTLEQLVALLPAMYLCARYWSPMWSVAAGLVYIAGRFIYLQAYARDPKTRTLGFGLSFFPIAGLLAGALAGALFVG